MEIFDFLGWFIVILIVVLFLLNTIFEERLKSEMQEWTIEKLMEYYEDQSNPSYYRTEALIIAQEKERESE